jgi:CDGSH-type Zn-finger protein
MATKITVKNNGSIRVEGEFELFDMSGKKFELNCRTTISFCRCGQSKDKPFCDGSHRECGFQSEITARELPPLAPKS